MTLRALPISKTRHPHPPVWCCAWSCQVLNQGSKRKVGDAIVVVVVVTLIANPILVRVQLGTVDDGGAVVCAVLVPVSVAVGEGREGLRHSSAGDTRRPVLRPGVGGVGFGVLTRLGLLHVVRGSPSLFSSHGRGIGPENVLKKDEVRGADGMTGGRVPRGLSPCSRAHAPTAEALEL